MSKFFNNIEANLSAILLAAMTIVTIVQIVFRYFISYSLSWPEELGRYLFIAAVYVGSSYAEKEDKHLAITVLRTNAGKWCARYIPAVAQAVNFVFSAVMTWWGVIMTQFVYDSNQLAPAILIPMYIIYAVLPLGMGCMTIRAFFNLIRYIKNAIYNTPDTQHERAEV